MYLVMYLKVVFEVHCDLQINSSFDFLQRKEAQKGSWATLYINQSPSTCIKQGKLERDEVFLLTLI